jgi:cephalosporin hydroxylase
MHICDANAFEITKSYFDSIIPAYSLEFIVDLKSSVGRFELPWTPPHDMIKIIEDVDRYEKIIADTQPVVIVECGTSDGGSAEWFMNRGLRVVTVDVRDTVPRERKIRCGEEILWLVGNSISSSVVEQIKDFVGNGRCMVAIDSDHHACHVLAEMELYNDLVNPGCYMVVEDGIFRWLPHDESRQWPGDHGPIDAIEAFMTKHDDFVRDEDIEKLHSITMDPAGWLRRMQ